MNKTISLIALCLGSAAVGGFIAVRLIGHPQPLPVAPTPSAAIGATSVTAPTPVSPVAVSQPGRIVQPMAAAAPVSTPVETRDDYDFDSLAGPSRKLAHRFDSESRDPDWASRAIDTVSHELESQPVFSMLSSVDVDCKVTLCRIEATLPLEVLQAMGPNANFSWGGIVAKLVQSPLGTRILTTSRMRRAWTTVWGRRTSSLIYIGGLRVRPAARAPHHELA
jgi:hypothetical protein